MKVRQIIRWTTLGVLLFTLISWTLIVRFQFHFVSADIPTFIPWFLVFLFGAFLFLSIKDAFGRKVVLVIFALLLIIVIPLITLFINSFRGSESEIFVSNCKGCDKKVISYYHQGSWGGVPSITTGVGDTYFGGLLYKMIKDTTYDAEFFLEDSIQETYVLPEEVKFDDYLIAWESEDLLIVNGGTSCYPLVRK